MNEVTLQQILDAREARANEQTRVLGLYRQPLICFSMNIAGPVKRTALIERAFFCGLRQLRERLEAAGVPVLYQAEVRADTGCEAFFSVEAEAQTVKQLCLSVEEQTPLGRLFDMDVLDPGGQKLARTTERRCLVCGKTGRGCASRRLHSVEELQKATRTLIAEQLAIIDEKDVAELATQALLQEVDTTPKPGLVDRENNGSHKDMTLAEFQASAEALRPYWARCFRLGRETATMDPREAFVKLREAGLEAEKWMLAATNGVNTHKGAIFLLGTLCGAVGRRWRAEAPCRDPEALLEECRQLYEQTMAQDFARMREAPDNAATAGARLYLQLGHTGARGQLAEGLPAVRETALPLFDKLLRQGLSENDAGALVLLALIARGEDTNLLKRGGVEKANRAAAKAAALLENGSIPSMDKLRELDREFIKENLSPGGCADLLALTIFLRSWRQG